MNSENEVGKTKDAGFQIGIRKTLSARLPDVWEFMFSQEGLRIWLGEIELDNLVINKGFQTDNGISGAITVLKPLSHVRMKWTKPGWQNTSRLQLRIYSSGTNTVIAFHQEMLLDNAQREEMKSHWKKVVANVVTKLSE